MTDKELKKLSRTDLVEMLLEVSRENEKLRWELAGAREQLDDKTITIENSGSLAEAALRLNGIFEAAQNACEQYTQNMRQRSCPDNDGPAESEPIVQPTEPDADPAEPETPDSLQMEQDVQMPCDHLFRETQEMCGNMVRDTQEQCDRMVQDTQEQCSRMEQEAQAKCDRMLKRARQDADEYWEYVRENARALHLEQHKSGQQDQNNL